MTASRMSRIPEPTSSIAERLRGVVCGQDAERYLGRALRTGEVVVCLDGNVKNVEAENLGIRRVGLPGVVTVLDMREVRG